MWKGRFQEETSALLQQYSESVSFDWRLWRHDIAGSIAQDALPASQLRSCRGN
jgi:argininosuccinate lyase